MTYTYDAVGRPQGWRYPTGQRITWSYDAAGNATLTETAVGRFTRTYDPMNAVIQLDYAYGQTLQWRRDALGQRRSFLAPGGGRTTYVCDGLGRTLAVRNAANERTTYTYALRGTLTQEQQANGTSTTYVYDNAAQTIRVAHVAGGSATEKFLYKYDLAGKKTAVKELSGELVTWSYDAGGQLTRERRSGANAYLTTYAYDLTGNRTSLRDGSGITTSVYDAADRIRYSQAASGRTTYTFDNAGNQVSERTPAGDITTNTWDADSRLVRVELPTNDLITYAWAPVTKIGEMRQIERDDGVDVTRLVWDNQNVVQETDDLNSVEAEYTYQPQPYGHLVSDRISGASSFYKFDALHSTTSQTNSGGTETDEYRYKAFGPSLYHTGTSTSSYTYVGDLGYRQDADTGNTNIRERDYRSSQGRFLSPDPLGEAGGDSNFYRYVANDPINHSDPSGHWGSSNALTGFNFTTDTQGNTVLSGNPGNVFIGVYDQNSNQVKRTLFDNSRYTVSYSRLLTALNAGELSSSWTRRDWDNWFRGNGTVIRAALPTSCGLNVATMSYDDKSIAALRIAWERGLISQQAAGIVEELVQPENLVIAIGVFGTLASLVGAAHAAGGAAATAGPLGLIADGALLLVTGQVLIAYNVAKGQIENAETCDDLENDAAPAVANLMALLAVVGLLEMVYFAVLKSLGKTPKGGPNPDIPAKGGKPNAAPEPQPARPTAPPEPEYGCEFLDEFLECEYNPVAPNKVAPIPSGGVGESRNDSKCPQRRWGQNCSICRSECHQN